MKQQKIRYFEKSGLSLVAMIAVLNCGSQALAQDNGNQWSGFYIGLHAGVGVGEFKKFNQYAKSENSSINGVRILSFLANSTLSKDNKAGILGGIYTGYNFNVGNFIYGLETDFSIGQIKQNNTMNATLSNGNSRINFNFNGVQQYNYGGTLRGRFGYSINQIMPYITGGLVIAENKLELSANGTINGVSILAEKYKKSNLQAGYVVGAGVEYLATANIIARVEYNYTQFGKSDFGTPEDQGALKFDTAIHQVRAGVSYKF